MNIRHLSMALLLGSALVHNQPAESASFKDFLSEQQLEKLESAKNYISHKWFTPNDNDPRVAAIATIGAAGSIMGIYKLITSKKTSGKIFGAGLALGFAVLALGSKDAIAFFEKMKAAHC
ncbi:MAG: hypothetical protein BWY54_00149 [Candidatus Dependentiae bacterium ADurb.Bin331]|nr:MAG: hypothetical protein BWY54_00149 [Candidatus Dependentiae bacterium ADurb.Bin331]